MIFDILLDALLDTLKTIPFLFAAFLALEALEHYSGGLSDRLLEKAGKAGPFFGAILGCIPQCGFSVASANLYSGGVITLGTLIAVFIATSDEAILIMLGNPGSAGAVLRLLLCKVIAGIIIGFAVDFIFRKHKNEKNIEDLCRGRGCGCSDDSGVLKPAARHTWKLAVYILVFNIILGFILETAGTDTLSALLGKDTLYQPFLAALIGLIPNCAASVMITELYLAGILGFPAAMAGLSAGAGVGLAVLFRENRPMRENFEILGILYVSAALVGVILELLI